MDKLYTYKLLDNKTAVAYDEAVLVTCIQGLFNRKNGAKIYLLSSHERPNYWLEIFMREGEWLHGREIVEITSLDELFELTKESIQGVVIWDENVPATLNVATTIAGVEDCIVMTKDMAEVYCSKWNVPIVSNLNEMFDGSKTGSKKNDAYRWAIENYLAKDRCSIHFLCLYEDSYFTRENGAIEYVVTRDWAVSNRSFVYDLSPWGDIEPADDLEQPIGSDLATYENMLSEIKRQNTGKRMTEVCGFFSFGKYSNIEGHEYPHDPVPTEWETVYIISKYNCYQNTAAHFCYNQSFHSKFDFKALKQGRPERIQKVENKTYLCIHMCDYDSALPFYDFLPPIWEEKSRGEFPLAWGVNPNLSESYPDIFTYFYKTRSKNDYFVGDASAAGYFNPSRLEKDNWETVIKHNKYFYDLTDMSISPMVLDWVAPTPQILENFAQFSKDGYCACLYDFHNDPKNGNMKVPIPKAYVQNHMMVDFMYNSICDLGNNPEEGAKKIVGDILINEIQNKPTFNYVRVVWVSAGKVKELISEIKMLRPKLDIEVVDPYNYFELYKRHLGDGSVG